jgi:hypothetical protein
LLILFPCRLGGGTTGFLCGLDVYYHAAQSRDLQELEQEDFAAQQEAMPWKVPTRSRQCMVDDLMSWHFGWPHARKGRECLQKTGFSLALPSVLHDAYVDSDGKYVPPVFQHHAPDDDLISKEAAEVWNRVSMPQARAEALAQVQEDFYNKKFTTAEDLHCYLQDESEPENEMWEGTQGFVAENSDSSDDDLSDAEAKPDDESAWDQLASAAAAPMIGGKTPKAGDAIVQVTPASEDTSGAPS